MVFLFAYLIFPFWGYLIIDIFTSIWQLFNLLWSLLIYSNVKANVFYKSFRYHIRNYTKNAISRWIFKILPFFASFFSFFELPVTSNYIYVFKIMYSIWLVGTIEEIMGIFNFYLFYLFLAFFPPFLIFIYNWGLIRIEYHMPIYEMGKHAKSFGIYQVLLPHFIFLTLFGDFLGTSYL